MKNYNIKNKIPKFSDADINKKLDDESLINITRPYIATLLNTNVENIKTNDENWSLYTFKSPINNKELCAIECAGDRNTLIWQIKNNISTIMNQCSNEHKPEKIKLCTIVNDNGKNGLHFTALVIEVNLPNNANINDIQQKLNRLNINEGQTINKDTFASCFPGATEITLKHYDSLYGLTPDADFSLDENATKPYFAQCMQALGLEQDFYASSAHAPKITVTSKQCMLQTGDTCGDNAILNVYLDLLAIDPKAFIDANLINDDGTLNGSIVITHNKILRAITNELLQFNNQNEQLAKNSIEKLHDFLEIGINNNPNIEEQIEDNTNIQIVNEIATFIYMVISKLDKNFNINNISQENISKYINFYSNHITPDIKVAELCKLLLSNFEKDLNLTVNPKDLEENLNNYLLINLEETNDLVNNNAVKTLNKAVYKHYIKSCINDLIPFIHMVIKNLDKNFNIDNITNEQLCKYINFYNNYIKPNTSTSEIHNLLMSNFEIDTNHLEKDPRYIEERQSQEALKKSMDKHKFLHNEETKPCSISKEILMKYLCSCEEAEELSEILNGEEIQSYLQDNKSPITEIYSNILKKLDNYLENKSKNKPTNCM